MRRLHAWFYLVVAALSAAMALLQPAEADALGVSSPAVADELSTQLSQLSQALAEAWPATGGADAAHAH